MNGRIVSGGRELSQQELFQRAARAATGFDSLGIGENGAVAMVHGVVPSTQRGALSRTAPKSPPSNFASMRSSVSAVGGEPAVDPPPPSRSTRPRSFA